MYHRWNARLRLHLNAQPEAPSRARGARQALPETTCMACMRAVTSCMEAARLACMHECVTPADHATLPGSPERPFQGLQTVSQRAGGILPVALPLTVLCPPAASWTTAPTPTSPATSTGPLTSARRLRQAGALQASPASTVKTYSNDILRQVSLQRPTKAHSLALCAPWTLNHLP